MSINKFITRLTILSSVVLILLFGTIFFSAYQQDKQIQNQEFTDNLLLDVTSFLLVQDEFENVRTISKYRDWKQSYDSLRNGIQYYPKLSHHIKENMEVLKDINLQIIEENQDSTRFLSSQNYLERRLDLASRSILSSTLEFTKSRAVLYQENLKLIRYFEIAFIIALIGLVGFTVYRFLISLSQSFRALFRIIGLLRGKDADHIRFSEEILKSKIRIQELNSIAVSFRQLLKIISDDLNEKNALINNTQDLIWSFNNDKRLITFNNAYKETVESVLNRKLKPGDTVVNQELGPELKNKWEKYFERVLGGESFTVSEKTDLGDKIVYSEVTFNPLYDRNGKITGATCYSSDLTKLKIIEKNLRNETERLKEAQEIGKMGDWDLDLNSGKLNWSKEVYSLFEWDPEKPEPYLQEVIEMFEAEDQKNLIEAIGIVEKEGHPQERRVRFKEDRAGRCLRFIGKPIFSAEQVIGIRGVVQDVSEQIKAEIAAKNYANRLEAVADNLPGAIFQYQLWDSGKDQMLYLSKGSLELWGLTPEDAMKNNMMVWNQMVPEDLPGVQKSIADSAKDLSKWNFEWRSKMPEGGLRWHQGIGKPTRLKNSVIWNSIILDISDRKGFELELRKSEAHLKQIYNNAFDGILACDEKGNLTFFNTKLKEWVGEPRADVSPAQYPEVFGLYTFDGTRLLRKEELSLNKAMQFGSVENNRFTIINELHSTTRYMEANGSSLLDEDGNVKGAVVIIRDITEQYERDVIINTRILDALEMERQSVASELHDGLTQTLSVASMNLNNFLLDYKDRSDKFLLKSIKYLDEAIDQSRNMAHTLMPKTIPHFGLIGAVEELVDTYKDTYSTVFDFYFNRDIRVDNETETQLYRVVQEALSNVGKHSNCSSCNIRIEFGQNHIELSILDDGVGFDVKSTNKGIGLLTMKNRMNKLGGKIDIKSSKEGTSVYASCPLTQHQDG